MTAEFHCNKQNSCKKGAVMKKSSVFLVLVAVVLSFSLFFCVTTASAQQKDVIKIGVLMNLTGPWASIDGPAWNSIQLAVDEINADGGLIGKKVQAICIDTKADEGETVSAAIRLIEREKVNAIIGYCDTHWVLTAAPIARDFGIPFITPGATHPRIPERSGAWLACFGDNAQAAIIAEYAYKDKGLKNAAVWIDNAVDFSVAVCAFFKDAFQHYGGQVVYEDFFETEWTDFSALVTRLKSSERKVDMVYLGAIPGNIGIMVKQIREAGITIPIFSEDGADTPLLAEVAGKYAEGVIITSHMTLESKAPMVVDYIYAYKKKFGRMPENAFAALGYDAMMLVADAIKKVNSDDPKMINAGIRLTKDFRGVTGTISYPAGSQVPNKSVSVLVSQGGKFQLVVDRAPVYMPPKEIAK
jgi:branched-chain amino acid transport system substrate-binding protein